MPAVGLVDAAVDERPGDVKAPLHEELGQPRLTSDGEFAAQHYERLRHVAGHPRPVAGMLKVRGQLVAGPLAFDLATEQAEDGLQFLDDAVVPTSVTDGSKAKFICDTGIG